jgi:hypothetical protein
MIRKFVTFIAAALPIVAFALAPASAMAQTSYTGNWPAVVTGTIVSNGTYCLALTEADGPHGRVEGTATWTSGGNRWDGQFFVIHGTMMVQIFVEIGSGQIGAQVWAAHASQGTIGTGVFGGGGGDDGKVVFGAKNGCTPNSL